jgi:hypothetical protein
MKKNNFNWIPADPNGNRWKYVYFIDMEDIGNYAYITLAEIKNISGKTWKWKITTDKQSKKFLFNPQGKAESRDTAIKTVVNLLK